MATVGRRSPPARCDAARPSPPERQLTSCLIELEGYANVALAGGQSRLVLFHLKPSDLLAYYDAAGDRLRVAPGRYTALLSTSSTELENRVSFEVGGSGHRR